MRLAILAAPLAFAACTALSPIAGPEEPDARVLVPVNVAAWRTLPTET